MKNNIALDIDGTCADVMEYVYKRIQSQMGIDVSNTEKFYLWEQFPVLTQKYVWDFVKESYVNWIHTPIYPGVESFIKRVYSISGDYIQFVTGREDIWSFETNSLVKRFCKGVPYQIAFVNGGDSSKVLFVKDRYKYFYEDRRKTALELAIAGIKVIVPYRSYNLGMNNKNISYLDGAMDLMVNIHKYIS